MRRRQCHARLLVVCAVGQPDIKRSQLKSVFSIAEKKTFAYCVFQQIECEIKQFTAEGEVALLGVSNPHRWTQMFLEGIARPFGNHREHRGHRVFSLTFKRSTLKWAAHAPPDRPDACSRRSAMKPSFRTAEGGSWGHSPSNLRVFAPSR
jgi:hypothetical protein